MNRTTTGAILRTTQAWCSQVCEKTTLTYGIAYYSQRFGALPDANQFREVVVGEPNQWAEAFDQCERWFTENKATCLRWAPAGDEVAAFTHSAGGAARDELRHVLLEHGFRERIIRAMRLVRWVDIATSGDIRIVPARAVRKALSRTFEVVGSRARAELTSAMCAERLDDPQFDMFVALRGDHPVGRCALYQVGDTARVMDLTVVPDPQAEVVEKSLMAYALGLAKRLAMPMICTSIDGPNALRQTFYERCGFVADGDLVEFDRIESSNPTVAL